MYVYIYIYIYIYICTYTHTEVIKKIDEDESGSISMEELMAAYDDPEAFLRLLLFCCCVVLFIYFDV